MKDNVIDILVYLLQNTSAEEEVVQYDYATLTALLVDAGFEDGEIHQAFRWLDELDAQISEQAPIEHAAQSTRCFSATEEALLDTASRDYLLSLMNAGILTSNSFELVIDRLLALDSGDIDLSQLEWIVLIVLSNQADQQAAFHQLEAMRFHEPSALLN